jgi:hypothetical protein
MVRKSFCNSMPDAAGGERGHGVAKPQGVVHRYALSLN